MHFLMPSVFASHDQFRDWFCNPLTGMVEGSEAYNKVWGIVGGGVSRTGNMQPTHRYGEGIRGLQ